ncbi:TPA: transposase [Pseudomonas aeruginosa]
MMTGSIIVAPEGYRGFSKNQEYRFLRNDGARNRVLLVLFGEGKEGMRANLVTLTRGEFESALEQGFLVEIDDEYAGPPWLQPIWGKSLSQIEEGRKSRKVSYQEIVDDRYMAIKELDDRLEEILASDNPNSIIVAHAKAHAQNSTRLKFWFYSYIAFGRQVRALLPVYHRIGHWDREAKARTAKKYGRPSRVNGRNSGFNVTSDMKEKILAGFKKHKGEDKTLNQIWRATLVSHFKCKSSGKDKGFVSPTGEPFPSENQFRDVLFKFSDREELNRDLMGKNLARSKSGSKGSFSAKLLNVNQRVELDGYNPGMKVSGLEENSAQKAFCWVRAVCGVSGAILGIGFAKANETLEAYKMCLFSMAVRKVKFCSLFGISIEDYEWPCYGLPSDIVVDRGPGATLPSFAKIKWLKALEIPPSYSGQSKATVESSHPRSKESQGQPKHFQADFNFVDMAKHAIFQVLKDNLLSDASARMEGELIEARVEPNPAAVWAYYSKRGRDSGREMPFEEAAREFLSPQPATIGRDAVYFLHRKYISKTLVESGAFDRAARRGKIPVKAYVLNACLRHIWIEYEGELLELDVVVPARAAPGSQDISLYELIELNETLLDLKAIAREQKPAKEQELEDRFEVSSGHRWMAGRRKWGPVKRSAASRADESAYRSTHQGGE